MLEPMSDTLARKTVKRYVCSMCWGALEIHPDPIDPEKNYVFCEKHQEETRGYVTRYFADRRRNESAFEKMDAENLLRRMGVIENPLAGKSQQELLKEIGY